VPSSPSRILGIPPSGQSRIPGMLPPTLSRIQGILPSGQSRIPGMLPPTLSRIQGILPVRRRASEQRVGRNDE